ncbi:MAG TPA: hypothetical protein VMS71_02950 [Candidatus Acidoferrum sp.]|nr:hypothetical protein [Candidatus Acidoferrum sp.]
MNRFLRVLLGLAMLVACLGCQSADKNQTGRTNAAGHPEELRDSTRLDPAGGVAATARPKSDSL